MQPKEILSNGDEIWVATFEFEPGSFGLGKMPITWGTNPGEFYIEAVDSAKQVSVYPTIKSGNYPDKNQVNESTHE